jgi:hypothetical protein
MGLDHGRDDLRAPGPKTGEKRKGHQDTRKELPPAHVETSFLKVVDAIHPNN